MGDLSQAVARWRKERGIGTDVERVKVVGWGEDKNVECMGVAARGSE